MAFFIFANGKAREKCRASRGGSIICYTHGIEGWVDKSMKNFLTGFAVVVMGLCLTACSNDAGEVVTDEVVAGLGRDAGGVYGHAHHFQPLTPRFRNVGNLWISK